MTKMSTYFQCFYDFLCYANGTLSTEKHSCFYHPFKLILTLQTRNFLDKLWRKSHVRHQPVELDVEVAAALLLLAAPNNDPDELPNVEAPVVA